MRTILLLLALSGLSIGATLTPVGSDDDTPLQESMGKLNSGLRTFRKAIKTAPETPAKKEEALSELLKMQASIQVAKVQVPEVAAAEDAGAGRAMTLAYRKDLIALQRSLLDLEVLVLDEKYSKVDPAIRKLLEQKKAGHDKYIEDA